MNIAKEEVQSILDRLPNDATIEDVQYHLYVVEKVRNGLEAADRGDKLTQEDVERRMNKWLIQ